MTTRSLRHSINPSPFRAGFLLLQLVLALARPALSQTPRAQDACREGCDFPLAGTYLGLNALVNNTTGFGNTATGSLALVYNSSGNYNTATGDVALSSNTSGSNNAATGYAALTNNTGNDNTATGFDALFYNTSGSRNVAIGSSALFSNQTGGDNTATGVNALHGNTGNYNTAHGYQALESNTTGASNTASGLNSLNKNTTGSYNAASGAYALYNDTAGYNTADGYQALYKNTTGSHNIALGYNAGYSITTGSNNIEIGNPGLAAEANTIRIGSVRTQTNTYIAGISGVTVAGGVGVIVDTNGHLGTVVSSERFKDAIKPMDKAREAILALKPVTFHYKKELDPDGIPQFGLVVEQVERVNPDLVARDVDGKAYTVRYDAVNAMLLNEFLKEHRTVQELKSTAAKQEATMATQQKRIDALTTVIQKISAQLEVARLAPQMVFNKTRMKHQTKLDNTFDSRDWLRWTWRRTNLILILAISWFVLAPGARAVEPPPDGGYANYNTAEGQDALFALTFGLENTALGYNALYYTTTGSYNTATGYDALRLNSTGSFNTATGASALLNTTTGGNNTATGYLALGLNTTGSYNTATGSGALGKNSTASKNTATGYSALSLNTTGTDNTAHGANALLNNTTGNRNVANGSGALYSNQTGGDNTATGVNALYANTGSYNTATGYQALESNTSGSNNTAHGLNSLNANTTGNNNTANGVYALFNNLGGNGNTAEGYLALHENTSGINNTALGTSSLYSNTVGASNIGVGVGGGFLTTGSNNIDIGNVGVAGESGIIRIGSAGTQIATYIAGIKGVPNAGGQVTVSSAGQLGIRTSSARFKEQIKPMEKTSEAIFSLKPVTFQYKRELDPEGSTQFGLVAEQVAKVDPDLVTRDDQGKPYTVRYEEINAMLLNEFLKEHRKSQEQAGKIEKLEATVGELESLLGQQNAQIQKWLHPRSRTARVDKASLASDTTSSLASDLDLRH
jgi:hypothetical protein